MVSRFIPESIISITVALLRHKKYMMYMIYFNTNRAILLLWTTYKFLSNIIFITTYDQDATNRTAQGKTANRSLRITMVIKITIRTQIVYMSPVESIITYALEWWQLQTKIKGDLRCVKSLQNIKTGKCLKWNSKNANMNAKHNSR